MIYHARVMSSSAQNTQCNNHPQTQRAGGEGGEQSQKGSQATPTEPHAPEVFKNQKACKAKVDEGSSMEGSKPFFRCYKHGHGKLECMAKLLCDICGNNEHITGRCPILKQPCLMAHPCGYDVNGLGFYHIPHAPITPGKPNNTKAHPSMK
jgi:hypothetical protein